MDEKRSVNLFSIRERWRQIRKWGGLLHLGSLVLVVLLASIFYQSQALQLQYLTANNKKNQTPLLLRQKLIEYMDRIIRYEYYYHDFDGQFTRDFSQLGLPAQLSSGTVDEVHRVYEVSVLEIGPNHLLILATGKSSAYQNTDVRMDRAMIDEQHRLSTNFPAIVPSKSYLYDEANRFLTLYQTKKQKEFNSVASKYWRIEQPRATAKEQTYIVGVLSPVLGEKRVLQEERKIREISSIFENVRQRVRSHYVFENGMSDAKYNFNFEEVRALLQDANLAEYIYYRERGKYAEYWEELDSVTGFQFSSLKNLTTNIRINPIEVSDAGYQISVEGMDGEVEGELFMSDQSKAIKQIRYAETIVQQLKESADFLEGTKSNKTKAGGIIIDRQISGQ